MEVESAELESAMGARLKTLRMARDMTLDGLAETSGVSRAMISRIERAEASPTASLLARLCSALGVSLSAFFETAEQGSPSPLARRDDQPVWRDPDSQYLRRSVSPPGRGSRVDVVEVEFPPGATVRFAPQPASAGMTQHVWLFSGRLEMTVGETVYRLSPGDCLHMNIGDVHGFDNPGNTVARYAVIIDLGRAL
jgi:transcriptional regulator with XRE-family HTH domain